MRNKYLKYRSYGHSWLISALAAPDIRLVLACAAAVGLLIGLSGCTARTEAEQRNVAQETLNELVPACRDGVQYLLTTYSGGPQLVVPRMKRDGTLYKCSIREEPNRVVEEWEQ